LGVKTLINRLWKKKDEQIKQLWQEAEKKAADIRKESAESINAFLHQKNAELTTATGNEELPILKKAAQRSLQTVLAGQERLLRRTYELACQSLLRLRDNQYPLQFERLVDEVPRLPWQEVAVHPDDISLAEQYFPEARKRQDTTISGGFLLSTENGKIEIDNTFEKRLEKIWSQLSPFIVEEIYEQSELQHDFGWKKND
jgi:vacuolar-type H+-ATPase subunit E/Vma4